tara:strand:- start:522 stop:1220 length:699 start_codon:yes stop_codon:yes gene_type:complete
MVTAAILLAAITSSGPLYAREGQPLTIDNLMVDPNHVDVVMGFSQFNLAGISGHSFTARSQWGAHPDVNITASYGASFWGALPTAEIRHSGFDLSWQTVREGRLPAVLLSASATRIDGAVEQWQMGLGATLWRSIDPVVLSLKISGFDWTGDQEQVSARSWEISPRINFAVNPDITLVSGWRFQRGNQSRQSASWGLAWAVATNLQIFIEHELESGAIGGSRFDLKFRYRLR